MAIVLDETTRAEYRAQPSASARASLVVAAFPAPVVVEVFDGADVLRASGTMAAPWATVSGSTITIGDVNASGLTVTQGGAPDASWYCQFRSGSRFVRGEFGLAGSGLDFTWSLSSFQTGSRGGIGTATLTTEGVPEIIAAPSISGTAQVGQVLSGDNGTWSGSPTSYTYQHQRSANRTSGWADISGATSTSYLLTASDQGQYVRRGVIAQNASGPSAAAYSATSGLVSSAGAVSLLSPSDVTYLGYYRLSGPPYLRTFAVRRVGGQLRFLMRGVGNTEAISEYAMTGEPGFPGPQMTYNSPVAQYTWTIGSTQGLQRSMWWDHLQNRMWFLKAIGYPEGGPTTAPTNIHVFGLPSSSGPLVSPYKISLQGVVDRKVWSGMVPVPAAAQAAYGIGPYAVGVGGYTSKLAQHGGATLGLSLYAIPEPSAYASSAPAEPTGPYDQGALIPTGAFQPLVTPSLAQAQRGIRTWFGVNFNQTGTTTLPAGGDYGYPGGTVATGTFSALAGQPVYGPLDYLQGGDPRSNPGTAPSFLPLPAPYNQNAQPRTTAGKYFAANSVASWNWDVFSGAFWIQTATKRGFVGVGSFGTGRSYYNGSTSFSEGRYAELQFYDPDDIGAVKAGTLSHAQFQPYALMPLADTFDNSLQSGNSGTYWFIAAFDYTTNRLYLAQQFWSDTPGSPVLFNHKIHVYQVNA